MIFWNNVHCSCLSYILGNGGVNPTKELSAPQCSGRAVRSGGTHADARVRGRYGVVQQD